MEKLKLRGFTALLASILLCEAAGLVGSVFTAPAIPTWYASLKKPFFTPPSWVFAPVWTALYALMGISVYVVAKKGLDRDEVRRAVSFFAVQLALNVLWSVVFFGMQSPLYGFIIIALLWVILLATVITFYRISKLAALLLVPYFLWGSFASALNLAILILNA